MRLLMLFTMGFCGACAVCAYLLCSDSVLWLLMGAASVCFFLSCLCLRKTTANVLAACLLGLAVGSFWYWVYDYAYMGTARAMDSRVLSAEISVTDYSFDVTYGVAADGILRLDGKPYQVRVYLNQQEPLEPGDRVAGEFRLRFTSTGAQKGVTFHRGDGKFLLASAAGQVRVIRGQPALSQLPARARHSVLEKISQLFPQDTAAFAAALLLGDDSGMSYEDSTALKISGIRHVVAVSGQHLVILMAAIMLLSGNWKRLACILSIPLLLLFSAMAGFSASILRACVMQLVIIFAFLSRQDYDGPTALSFAVLLMVVLNPLAITSVGLQLSAGSLIGMFLFSSELYHRIRNWYFWRDVPARSLAGRLLHWVVGSVSVTLSAMVVTAVLCAICFKTVSLIGIVTNLATLWLISLIFCGVLLAVLLGAVWLPLGAFVAKVLAWPIRYVLGTARLLATVPAGCLYLRNDLIILVCCVCYGIFLVCLFSRRMRICYSCVWMAAILTAGLGTSWLQPAEDSCRMTVLDVGQGQCILLQSGQRTYVVDCGGDYPDATADIAAETLLSMGICRIDGLILSHFDEDHAGAADLFLTRIQTDNLFLPEDPQHPYTRRLPALTQGQVHTVTQDMTVAFPGGRLTVFAGNGGDFGNEMSLCVLFQAGNCDILITGDRPVQQELALLQHTQLPEVDILVAGHHGADTSTGRALLEVTRPDTVVLSLGANNRFGHPGQSLLQRLREFGCQVRRTDLEGTIIIRR